jgi:hypothetical protein
MNTPGSRVRRVLLTSLSLGAVTAIVARVLLYLLSVLAALVIVAGASIYALVSALTLNSGGKP